MACACTQRKQEKFLWYDPANAESVEPVVYDTKMMARAKVSRKGGKYIPYRADVSIEAQIAAAESKV